MSLADNIRKIREERGFQQKQVAIEVGLGISHYNRMEKGEREVSVKVLEKLAKLYGVTIDQIVNMDNEVPKEVVLEDKTAIEQMRLLAELDEKDRSIVFAIIDKMLTNKKFKDFFNKNVAAL
jgi:transcriptional regulator with XRE-family HTH domain